VFMPREIVRELRRNLLPRELQAVLAQLRQAADVYWDVSGPPEATIKHYGGLGAKKGDAVIAAHLDASGIRILLSENRHFLSEIPSLPFRVLTAAEALQELG